MYLNSEINDFVLRILTFFLINQINAYAYFCIIYIKIICFPKMNENVKDRDHRLYHRRNQES